MGCLGMSLGDFRQLLPHQLSAILRHYGERRRDEWERMRLLATLTLQPHSKKALRPHSVLPLPWDAEERTQSHEAEEPGLTLDERRQRVRQLQEAARKSRNRKTT